MTVHLVGLGLSDTAGLSYGKVRLSLSRQKLCHSEGIRVDLPNIYGRSNEGFLRKPVLSLPKDDSSSHGISSEKFTFVRQTNSITLSPCHPFILSLLSLYFIFCHFLSQGADKSTILQQLDVIHRY